MITRLFLILKIISIIISALIFNSCLNSKVEALNIGKYASKIPNKWSFFKTNSSIGDTLTVKTNKVFTLKTCGNIYFGYYKINNNKLILDIDSTFVRGKEVMYYEKYLDTFTIKSKNLLIKKFKAKTSKESKETFNAITELYYIED